MATPLVKYGRDLKLLMDSPIEQSFEKSLSVAGQVSKTWRLNTFLSNKLGVKIDPPPPPPPPLKTNIHSN